MVLVGHALGGVTISQTAEARRRKIKALVYVCGLMPPSGKASREMTAGDPEILFRRSREVSPDGLTYTFARAQLPALFYEDVSPEDRYRAMERLRPQPISISTTPVTLTEERYGSVPRWYIECTHDNAIRIAPPARDGEDPALQGHHHGMRPHARSTATPRNWPSIWRRSPGPDRRYPVTPQ